MNKKYSEEDELFIKKNLFILSNNEIANHFGYTKVSIIQKKKEMNLNKNKINPFLSSFRSFLFNSLDLLQVGKRLKFDEDATSTIKLYVTEYNKDSFKAISFIYNNSIFVLKISNYLPIRQYIKSECSVIKYSIYEIFESIKHDDVIEVVGIGKRTINLYLSFFNKENKTKKISYRNINNKNILFRIK